jgi:hypothetical protein
MSHGSKIPNFKIFCLMWLMPRRRTRRQQTDERTNLAPWIVGGAAALFVAYKLLKTNPPPAQVSHFMDDPDTVTFCAICQDEDDPINDTNRRILPCEHTFHADCVNPWLKYHGNACPTCRQTPKMINERDFANYLVAVRNGRETDIPEVDAVFYELNQKDVALRTIQAALESRNWTVARKAMDYSNWESRWYPWDGHEKRKFWASIRLSPQLPSPNEAYPDGINARIRMLKQPEMAMMD